MGSWMRLARTVSVVAGLALAAGCAGSGAAKRGGANADMTEVAFQGRVISTGGQPIPKFTLSVERLGTGVKPFPVQVPVENSRFSARVPTGGKPSGDVLGQHTEKVAIRVSAPGHKNKQFNATANQLLVGQPNSLDVTLEPR